mgnify:CR=1 FL=1
MSGRVVLAIDTATQYAGVALYDGEAVLCEKNWRSRDRHTVELMPTIMAALEQQSLTAPELGGLAVAIGPGSFTGLRVGLSVAKGIAFATGKPLLGIPTLDILGYACAREGVHTCAVIQAGRGRLCAATYRREQGLWRRLDEYRILSQAELVARIESPTLFCGELGPRLRAFLQEALGDLASLATPAECARRASYLAELGWQRLLRGERDNLTTLTPIYLHDPFPGASA